MVGSLEHVKTTRPYNSARRRARARQNRERVLEVAEDQFLSGGYAQTSLAAVAAAAAVSVDTVYKTFGGKPGLIRAIVARALEGDGPIRAEDASDRLQAEESDPRAIITGWGRFVTQIAPRAAPVMLLVRDAAATDPELRSLLAELDRDRLRRMRANAGRLHQKGHLRPGVSAHAAADILWAYSSPDLYDLLVLRRGMSLRRYGTFVAEAIAAALL